MKQNKKNVAVFLSVLVLFSFFSLPAFAYTDTSSNGVDFSNQPLPTYAGTPSADYVISNGIQISSANESGNRESEYYLINSSSGEPNDNVFCFTVNNRVYFYSTSSFNYYGIEYSISYGSKTVRSGSSSSSSIISGWYSTSTALDLSRGTLTNNVPSFSSEEIGAQAVQDWIYNPPVSVTPHSLNYSIPAGYVAYFEIPSNETIRASVTTTSGIPLTPAQWASTNVLYGYSSSLPSGAFTLPITGSTSFSWNTGKTNLFGKSQHWSWLGTINTSSKYYFISNPTYSNVVGTNSNGSSMIVDNPSATNGYVDVYLSSVIDVKLFPLKSTITYDPSIGAYGGIDDGASGESYSVGYDDTTGQWVTTDPTGNPVGVGGVPIGGDNSIDSIPTSDTIVDWLENIARTIGAFFRGAVGAVTTLVGAGSDFIHALVGLYSWLPGSVYAVLSSALILVIVIGVIKVFV